MDLELIHAPYHRSPLPMLMYEFKYSLEEVLRNWEAKRSLTQSNGFEGQGRTVWTGIPPP